MLHLFCPDYRCTRISEIPITWLQREGIKAIILDLDNTLLPWDANMPAEENLSWVQRVKAAGIRVVLLSNNGGERLHNISQKLGVEAIGWGIKPLSRGFKRALRFLNVQSNNEVLVIGDQLLTDVFGAKKMKFKVIWVESLSSKEFAFTRITRKVESIIIKRLTKKGIMPGGKL
ncbi:MAG: YqeG family HAD IIIA-type phosphatase [Acidaminococcaceae bacterium]